MKTKFSIQELLGIGLTLVVLGIGLAYGMEVIGDVKEDACDGAGENFAADGCYSCVGLSGNTTFRSSNLTCDNGTGPAAHEDAYVTGSVDYNASQSAITGIAKIPEKMPTIATVIIAAAVIGVLITYLWGRFQ